ncbi:PQ-loop repeat family protein / transmembrane family protein [Reticulomyxa filosa]|uniref:Mannose-P-dolichol utilization defect 1 protein homolog n=1 Tax=Reticulomyxa filosa TaxID=46433 RepID=X6PH21_RETFI|nr:PQ-loop repeat family protein / transmembrane family protein [Reticulomyxa filosa]|eukprot:ETO36987.1 PQ-loop repeat family protein / transmembrane family protein [Reticulomyxa filosa]
MSSEELVWLYFTPKCFEHVRVFDINGFLAEGCLKKFLSKFLGYGVTLGGFALKLPQIQKVISAQSAKGLSVPSLAIETFNWAVTGAYFSRQNYPISTYGETPVVFMQNMVLLYLIFQYQNQLDFLHLAGLFLGFLLCAFMVTSPLFPFAIVSYLYSSQMIFVLSSKIPQIWQNYSAKSTGQLAFLTSCMQFAGACSRLFTTIQEVNEFIPIAIWSSSVFVNGIIFAQFLLYWNQPQSVAPNVNAVKSDDAQTSKTNNPQNQMNDMKKNPQEKYERSKYYFKKSLTLQTMHFC